jgi:hypothetical protein
MLRRAGKVFMTLREDSFELTISMVSQVLLPDALAC